MLFILSSVFVFGCRDSCLVVALCVEREEMTHSALFFSLPVSEFFLFLFFSVSRHDAYQESKKVMDSVE